MRFDRVRAPLAALLLAAVLVAAAPAARAETDDVEGPGKLGLYMGCAVGLAAAETIPAACAAFMACVRLFFDELNHS